MEKIRLQKILSEAGYCSRRKAEEFIAAGKVKVNGRPCRLGDRADPFKDNITVNEEKIIVDRKKIYRYIMLNKPRGIVTTMSDELDRRNVTELLEGVGERVYPVG
ncbi:MAG: S4 domain-containing protein, partial [Oscillospiraceae bacterium]